MSNPEQLIADFESRMAESQRKAERMVGEIEAVSVSERSKDGQIGVKVDHAGNLVDLEIGPSVRDKPDLAGEILRTVKAAQSKLAAAMRVGVTDPVGPEVMNQLVNRLEQAFPAPEPEGFVPPPASPRNDGDRFVPEEERQAAPAPKPAPPRAPRPSSDDGHDDDYFSDGDYLR
ncbi:YbaB/EbfC family nucleoid-associated protein [Amycolatopsis sp. SID8362]|uniref:YbaB/EbfC family nucleoid-associated protein n=1 Tax=Amycolatopsis sp. SID8362 TaxID=2690346 RepID=UPI00136E6406|nr:YbaB/EbfC family nucleoid-associated protein [Amycolatopsis sp. SID8362]NBH09872.1 YbaB/EbfC family DNA-binding protein [Amycolatopsis sp. SID8362]NED46565.1 YbaB/EbfC family nucleoid-associated protein [Amycolatopsis sp. SID8362]